MHQTWSGLQDPQEDGGRSTRPRSSADEGAQLQPASLPNKPWALFVEGGVAKVAC